MLAAGSATLALGGCASLVPPSPTPARQSPSPSFVRPTPTPLPTAFEYVVHSGDSLTSIARRFSTTPHSIALWNASRYPTLDPSSSRYAPDRIGVGWRLTLVPGMTFEEAAEVSAGPTSALPSPPAPSIPPGPTPRPDGVAVFVAHAERSTDATALTFDLTRAGLPVGTVDAALDLLAGRNVPATVFVSAPLLASGDPAAEEVLTRSGGAVVVGLAAGGRGTTAARLRAPEAAAAAAGVTTEPWYRPATNDPPEPELETVGRAGWAYAIGWDVDATAAQTADDLVAFGVSRSTLGSIIRLDLADPDLADALPDLLDGLAGHGLVPVTIPVLLGR
ncbi:MAG TPA: LysM peptidoglycan-binding domain-containing protein [Candidatus Limnocylindrales bacterium]